MVLVTLRRDHDALAWQLRRIGITGYFERLLATGGSSATKASLWPSRLRTGDEVVVGDGEPDLEFARAIGAPCVSVTYGMRTAAYLRGRGATVLADAPAQIAMAIDRLGDTAG